MKPQLSNEEMRDAYWYPCSPFLRWILLFLGLFSIGYATQEWIRGNDFRFFPWIIGLWMIGNTWRPPVLKRKSWVERNIVRLLVGLILLMALGLLLFAAYTWLIL